MEILNREALKRYKQSMMANVPQSSEDQNANRNVNSKVQAQEPFAGNMIQSAVGVEAMNATLWQNICVHFARILRLKVTEIKGGGLISNTVEISRV